MKIKTDNKWIEITVRAKKSCQQQIESTHFDRYHISRYHVTSQIPNHLRLIRTIRRRIIDDYMDINIQ